MKFRIVTLAALLALPAVAQERWSVGFGFNHHPEVQAESRGSRHYLSQTRKDTWTPSLLASFQVLDLGRSRLAVTGECQFRSRTDLETYGLDTSNALAVRQTTDYRTSFWAPGVSWDFRRALDFGFGLQYRFARLESSGLKENYPRPWINAYVGHTFRTRAQVKPFVALRQSVALTTTGANDLQSLLTEDGRRRQLRALDADAVTSLQFGLRF